MYTNNDTTMPDLGADLVKAPTGEAPPTIERPPLDDASRDDILNRYDFAEIVDAYLALRETNTRNIARIQSDAERVREMNAEFSRIAEALVNEARERNWCSEYDDFVNGLNSQNRWLTLENCARDYLVTIELRVRVEATNDDNADELAEEHMSSYYRGGGDWEITDTSED